MKSALHRDDRSHWQKALFGLNAEDCIGQAEDTEKKYLS